MNYLPVGKTNLLDQKTYQIQINGVRQRNITYFNALSSGNEETNIGNAILKLINKIFQNNLQIPKNNQKEQSFSCLNFTSMIKSDNNRFWSVEKVRGKPKCFC